MTNTNATHVKLRVWIESDDQPKYGEVTVEVEEFLSQPIRVPLAPSNDARRIKLWEVE